MSGCLSALTHSPAWKEHIVERRTPQRVLRCVALVGMILSLIPPLRLAGGLALRSTMVVISLCSVASNWSHISYLERALLCARVACVALGLVAVALNFPLFLLVSVVADTALHLFQAIQAFSQKRWLQGSVHLAIIAINVLTIAALATGMWPLFITAMAVSLAAGLLFAWAAVVFTAHTNKGATGDAITDGLLFSAALILNIFGLAFNVPHSYREPDPMHHYTVTNPNQYSMVVYDSQHHIIAIVQPGETAQIDVASSSITTSYRGDDNILIETSYTQDPNWVHVTEMPTLEAFEALPLGSTAAPMDTDPRYPVIFD